MIYGYPFPIVFKIVVAFYIKHFLFLTLCPANCARGDSFGPAEHAKLFSKDFWQDALLSLQANSGKIFANIIRSGQLEDIRKILSKKDAAFLIYTPTPPKATKFPPLPFLKTGVKIAVGKKRIPLKLVLGSASSHSGRLLGMGVGSGNKNHYQSFRMDWHKNHPKGVAGRIKMYQKWSFKNGPPG